MKLIDITEGVSPVLFHATSIASAVRAVERHQMVGFPLDDGYVLSFARSRTGNYPEYMGDDMQGSDEPIVVLELDGNRLGQRYRGKSIDPFAPSRGDIDYGDYERSVNYTEDRITGKKQVFDIMPATFKRAHLITNGSVANAKALLAASEKLQKQIPCLFYNTVADFQSNRPVKQPKQGVRAAVVQPGPFISLIQKALSGSSGAINQFLSLQSQQKADYTTAIAQAVANKDRDINFELTEIISALVDDGHVKPGSIRTVAQLVAAVEEAIRTRAT